MKLSKQQIEAIALKISGEQESLYKKAIQTDEQLLLEIEIRKEFWSSEAYRKLQLLEKAQKVMGAIPLKIFMNTVDYYQIDYQYTKSGAEWNIYFDELIKKEALKRLKSKYITSIEKIQQQIVLATIDSSTLEELIQKVTLALIA